MKPIPALCLAVALSVILLASCSTLRSAIPVKAGYDADKAGFDIDEEGWASRHIPGIKALSNFVPPPNEARTKWDDWQKKRDHRWSNVNSLN
jgi:uncharacterized protein YceK